MTLTSEYQYIGRSNAVKDRNGTYSYYLLLYAKTAGDVATGRHAVTVKMRLASQMNMFYGYATSGALTVAGVSAASWSWASVPNAPWNTASLTEGGVTYPKWVDLKEGSVTVDVGFGVTKNITLAASFTMNDSSYGYFPQTGVAAEVSASVTLPMIAGASQPSLSASAVDMGSPVTISTNRVSDAFTHTLTYAFGGTSGTIATGVGSSVSWTPSLELARQIPSAVSGTAIITCTTYSGSKAIGSKQVTLTLKVPASVVPTVSFTYTDVSGAQSKLGVLVQGISAVSVDGGGTGAYGSTIASTAVTLAGKAYGGGTIKDSGSLALKLSVTDSRGRTGSAVKTLSVAAYQIPGVTVSASRCTANGTADDTGSYAKITVTGTVTQVNGKNSGSLKVSWGAGSETVSVSAGNVSWQKIVAADENATVTITAVLTDALASASRTMVLSTGYATLDLLSGGKGIAFGKAATREGFDCAMKAYFSGGLYGIAADGTVDSKSLFERVAALEAKLGI